MFGEGVVVHKLQGKFTWCNRTGFFLFIHLNIYNYFYFLDNIISDYDIIYGQIVILKMDFSAKSLKIIAIRLDA